MVLQKSGVSLPGDRPLGVAVVFLPENDEAQRAELEAAVDAQHLTVLKWRPVPVRPDALGEIANSTRPAIWHVLITARYGDSFEQKLYLARKQFQRAELPAYVASMSSATMV